MKRYLIAGALTGTIVAAIYAAPAATQGRPAAPAVRIQAGDGGTLGLAHTVRFEGAVSPSIDGGVASVYIAQGAGGVLSVGAAAPVASSGGLTPTVSLTPCPTAGQILKSDGGAWGCVADEQGVTSVTGSAPITSSGGTTPAIGCTMASSSQAGCLSSTDWTAFNGKEVPLVFGSGLWRAGNVIACINANVANEGCVSLLEQWFAGLKHFTSGVITNSVAAEADGSLTLSSTDGSVSIASGTEPLTSTPRPINLTPASGVVGLLSTDRLYCPAPAARTFYIDVATATAGRAVVAVTNSGNIESNYAADFDVPKGDIYTCSTKRIDCDGNASFTSISSGNWGSHGHTDAGGGGTLSASAIGSGTLPAARGGTGLSTPTSDAVMVGTGSAWQAKVLSDCDAVGGRLQYDATANTFSCATLGAWSTISSFSNGWGACTGKSPRYRKDADGQVHLSGCIASGTVDATAFTLGTGYQPAATRGFAVGTGVGAPATCLLIITSGGAVQPRSGCDAANAVYLDGISFFTD